jgi:hypothetical protein
MEGKVLKRKGEKDRKAVKMKNIKQKRRKSNLRGKEGEGGK